MRPRLEREEYWKQTKAGLNALFAKYEIDQTPCWSEVGLGWLPILDEAFEKMIEAGWNRKLAQVKQKFCQLRIYIDDSSYVLGPDGQPEKDPEGNWIENGVGKAISEACAQADRTCEVCGKEREKKGLGTGWALCNACGTDVV